ncbi:hypothetical protein ZWY2020_028113 [Hordeum vulgare]|nr:hypothetical protein ZWY2020_028113 [Hordeum vulgare]
MWPTGQVGPDPRFPRLARPRVGERTHTRYLRPTSPPFRTASQKSQSIASSSLLSPRVEEEEEEERERREFSPTGRSKGRIPTAEVAASVAYFVDGLHIP